MNDSSHLAVARVPLPLREQGVMRLVGGPIRQRRAAARRLIANGAQFGIDFEWLFGAWEGEDAKAIMHQVCLMVPGAGRTGMAFLSGPQTGQETDQLRQHRLSVLECALEAARNDAHLRVSLAQMLPEPEEAWAIEACERAGFIHVGNLAYLRCPLDKHRKSGGPLPDPDWPEGVTITPLIEFAAQDGQAALAHALERSYEATLDCPELCGLRPIEDVIASHRSTGVYDPALWWIVKREEEPEGCCLLSRCPEQDTTELVYIGLSPRVRGGGLGRRLLVWAMAQIGENSGSTITCAVDERNTPALRMYDQLGFERFTGRVAMVRPLERPIESTCP